MGSWARVWPSNCCRDFCDLSRAALRTTNVAGRRRRTRSRFSAAGSQRWLGRADPACKIRSEPEVGMAMIPGDHVARSSECTRTYALRSA